MSADPDAAVEVRTTSEEETEALGARLAETLPRGTTIALTGPLGAGKTVFARGVATGLGIDPRDVTSPTFVYLVDYPEGRIPFAHADLYRFADLPAETVREALDGIGLVATLASDAITLVEWWPYYEGAEPERLVSVELAVESGDVRSIHLNFRGPGLDAARRRVLP
ncbi:MAG: tRNA (adenosine(37)-N6)-threonylcarbamoyltransferase complex ATPase subunit type 1 TsaE [Candidatus Binatia bacterium]